MKELYQSYLFRKKCQSSDEFFKNRTSKLEAQLWTVEEIEFSADLSNIKLEPFTTNEAELETIYELQPEELSISQLNNEIEFDEVTDIPEETRPRRTIVRSRKARTPVKSVTKKPFNVKDS